jgi:hypothetical protein
MKVANPDDLRNNDGRGSLLTRLLLLAHSLQPYLIVDVA